MKDTMALALQQKAVAPALKAVLTPELADKLVAPICDALKTCYCKDELARVEIAKAWAAAVPQCMGQLDKFIDLMGQFIDAVSEYDKLTIAQTNKIIEKIFSEPDVPFAEKNAAIRDYMQMQYAHKEKQTKTYVTAGLGGTAVVAGVAATKILSDNKTKRVIEVAKTAKVSKIVEGITSLTPTGAIKAIGDTAVNLLKIIKK